MNQEGGGKAPIPAIHGDKRDIAESVFYAFCGTIQKAISDFLAERPAMPNSVRLGVLLPLVLDQIEPDASYKLEIYYNRGAVEMRISGLVESHDFHK